VYGVGLDFNNSTSLPYHAFITFADNTTLNVPLSTGSAFWGITSGGVNIQTIHLGLANGGSTTSGSFSMDDLTIGSGIPAPGALALIGLAGLASRRRRR
jgi:MYXO-CTERM domain-containing protein